MIALDAVPTSSGARSGVDPGSVDGRTRSNAAWLADLRTPGARDDAIRALCDYLGCGLRKALAGRHLFGVDVDDLTQEAVLRVLDRLDTFRGDSRFTTWAMAVAIRVALAALRRRRYREVPIDDLGSAALDRPPVGSREGRAFDQLARRGLLGALETAIGDVLTERQRQAVLGELAGVPSDELAGRLQINRNALYKLHHDARKKLRHAILDAGFTAEDVRDEIDSASERWS